MRTGEAGIGTCRAASGDGADDPGRGLDHANRVIFGIDDEDDAVGSNRHLLRCIEHGLAGVVAISAMAARAGASHGADNAILDFTDTTTLAFHPVKRSVGCEGDGAGAENAGLGGGFTVAVVAGPPR